ncbi:MAG: hypothetical protein AB7N76_18700 [Planctomycetota bacterium]
MAAHGHETPEEPEKDRAVLSIVVVGLMLGLALLSYRHAERAPVPLRATTTGPIGAVAVPQGEGEPAQLRGAVLQRGAAIEVITPDGATVVPRERVLDYDSESAQALDQRLRREQPEGRPAAGARRAPAPERAPARGGVGTVINSAGDVFVGRLEVSEQTIRVALKSGGAVISVPRQDVRWFALGVEGPDADYWARFAKEPIDPAFSRRPDARQTALSHRLNGRWEQATRTWARVCLDTPGDAEAVRELADCAKQWQEQAVGVEGLHAALRGIEDAIGARGLERPELRRLLGERLVAGAEAFLRDGDTRSARAYGQRLVDLGGDLAPQGQRLIDKTSR